MAREEKESKRSREAAAAVEADRDERSKALQRALSHIEKQYGKGSVMRLGTDETFTAGAITTGSVSLDMALGVGGLPRGRVTEIYGPEGSGKTTLAMHVLANAQRQGGTAAIIDAEHAFDTDYGNRLGLKLDDLLVSQPDSGEQALDVAELLVRSNAVDVVVVDSVAALVPKAELEGEMGDTHVGLQARLMSQALRKLSGAISKSRAVMIFINQIREKIGVMYGNPEVTPGGRALKFYSSVRIEVRRVGSIKAGEAVIGNRVRAKVTKNKVAPPFRSAEFDIMFGKGISREGDILDSGLALGIVEKSGAWISYGEMRLGQGRENAKQFFVDHPDVAVEVEKQIVEKAHATHTLGAVPAPEGEDAGAAESE